MSVSSNFLHRYVRGTTPCACGPYSTLIKDKHCAHTINNIIKNLAAMPKTTLGCLINEEEVRTLGTNTIERKCLKMG